MDPLSAIVITISLGGIAGAVYAAQREARHHRHLGTDHHEDSYLRLGIGKRASPIHTPKRSNRASPRPFSACSNVATCRCVDSP
jgi:hypothetical protein